MDIDTLVSHIVCPHCWHRFYFTDIVWISKHEDLRGDPIVGPDAFVRFRASRFDVNGAALDARGLPCEGLACPRCHLAIPRIFLEGSALIFSIIGVPGSGKSYYLATMTWELRRLLTVMFGLSFTDTDPLNNLILNQYERTLFLQSDRDQWVYLDKTEEDSEVYDQVTLEEQAVRLPHPFLFTMRPAKNHPNAHKSEGLRRILCFYDNAGEHFRPGADTAISPVTQHVAQSKVLMFLYDPTQDQRFRQRCQAISNDPQLYGKLGTDRQDTVMTEAAIRVRTFANRPPNRKVDKPLIVMVNKSDIWDQLIDEDFSTEPLIKPDAHQSKLAQVDMGRIEAVSDKVRQLLLDVAAEFVAAAEGFCDPVIYIPVSPLGGSPRLQENEQETPEHASTTLSHGSHLLVRPKDITPRWVTVPILYAFARWSTGLVAGARI